MNLVIIFLLFSTGCVTASAQRSTFSNSIPVVFISYSPLFDQVCERTFGQKIPPVAKVEGPRRQYELIAQWQKDSPYFFNVLINRIGRGYPRKEETVSLTSCNILSVSDPVMIPLKRWLVSLGGREPLYGFSDVVFHELLHRYLSANFDINKSALIRKYQKENQQVLAHIHLMALQKMIYIDLRRNDLIKWLNHDYNELIGGDYKRAWEIVNTIESYQALVNELPLMTK